MLRTIGIDELKTIIEEQEKVGVACEFCNQKYEFDSVDVEELFVTSVAASQSDTRH